MPPRKRARLPQRSSPTSPSTQKTPTLEDAPIENLTLTDSWTDEEEVGLFKGLIRCKPTGLHKHFNVLALHHFLHSNGYVHPRNDHTTLPGIWKKLDTLYDLEALDLREDARQLSDLSESEDEDNDEARGEDGDEYYSEAANKIHNVDFSLPDGYDFTELQWQRRLAPPKQRRDESPPVLPDINLAEAPPVRFTPSFSVEPEDLDQLAPKRRRGRPKGSGKRISAAMVEVPSAKTRRSTRHTGSVADTDENGLEDESSRHELDDEDEEDDQDGDGGNDLGEEENESEDSSEVEVEKDDTESESKSTNEDGDGGNISTSRRGRKARDRESTKITRASTRRKPNGR